MHGFSDSIYGNIWIEKKTFKEGPKCRISGFRSGVNDICLLLGCYVAQFGGYLATFRCNLYVPSSREKTVNP